MSIWQWIGIHGFELFQAVGIVGGLAFSGLALRGDDRSRRISNLLILTGSHREIWTQLYRRPELARVLDSRADLSRAPVSDFEAVFVTFVILHLASVRQAMREGLVWTGQAIERDVRWFFSLPIPRTVWKNSKTFQDPDLVKFVEDSLVG